MNREIESILTASEGRYLTKAEQSVFREWSARLDARLAAIDELQSKEETIVRQTINDVFKAYPDFEKRMSGARASCNRDLTLVLRYCGQALLRQDSDYLEDSLLSWMATILRGVGFAPDFVRDTYRTLGKHVGRELSPANAELLRPFIDQCVTSLASGQEDTDKDKEKSGS